MVLKPDAAACDLKTSAASRQGAHDWPREAASAPPPPVPLKRRAWRHALTKDSDSVATYGRGSPLSSAAVLQRRQLDTTEIKRNLSYTSCNNCTYRDSIANPKTFCEVLLKSWRVTDLNVDNNRYFCSMYWIANGVPAKPLPRS